MTITRSTITLAQAAAVAATLAAITAWAILARAARCAPAAEVWAAGYDAGRGMQG